MLKSGLNLLELKIETVRLILVPTDLDFKEEIFKEFDEEITTFMNPVPSKTIAETEEYITRTRKNMSDGKEVVCAVLKKDTKEFLGHAGLHDIETSTPELGVWIKKSAHGEYYGREAMRALKTWADENLEYEYIHYPVAVANTASRKIPESLGGKVVKEYMFTTMSGKTLPYVDYRITK